MSGTVTISGNIIIGSVTANVDSIYIQSGNNITGSFYQLTTTPTEASSNPEFDLVSGANGEITSIVQYIGASSYTKTLTWEGGSVLINIGSWA